MSTLTELRFWELWRNKYLLQKIYKYIRGDSANGAAYTGNIQAFIYGILTNYSLSTVNIAAKRGYLDIIIWLYTNHPDIYTIGCTKCHQPGAMDLAAANGHMHILQWFHKTFGCGRNVIIRCTSSAIYWAVENNHEDIIKWLYINRYKEIRWSGEDIINTAAATGNLNLIKWLSRNYEYKCNITALTNAAKHGHIEILKYLQNHRNICYANYFNSRAYIRDLLINAAEHGHVEILKYLYVLYDDYLHSCSWLCLELAVTNGHLKVAKWLYNISGDNTHFCTHINETMMRVANNGHLETMQWLGETLVNFILRRYDILIWRYNDIRNLRIFRISEIMQLLKQYRHVPYFTPDAFLPVINNAAANGHLNVIEWVYDQFYYNYEIYYKYSIETDFRSCVANRAAMNGHFEIVKWLIDNTNYKCTDKIIEYAAESGHLDMVKWLYEKKFTVRGVYDASLGEAYEIGSWSMEINCKFDNIISALDNAVRNDYIEIVDYLYKKLLKHQYNYTIDMIRLILKRHIDYVIGKGRIDLAELLYDIGARYTLHAVIQAVTNGHLDMVKWLNQHKSLYSPCFIDYAASAGHLDILKWLYTVHTPVVGLISGNEPDPLIKAAVAGHLHIIKWVCANKNNVCDKNVLYVAATTGHLDIVQWLHENYRYDLCEKQLHKKCYNGKQYDVANWLRLNCKECHVYKKLKKQMKKIRKLT